MKTPDVASRARIPAADPRAGYLAHRDEIDAAVRAALDGGRYILGPEVQTFEREWAAYLGAEFAIGVGSGTDALLLALRACGVGAGDEVITVSHTAVATVAAIEMCGATPVLVDVELETMTLDSERLEAARSSRTRAVIAVHLYGQAADLDAIGSFTSRHDLTLIEDAAQSHGAAFRGRKTGAIGDIAAFSFYPTKNLGAIGDGGAVVTSNAELAERTRRLREYGWRDRYVSDTPGWNSRLDELQAAILRVKLRHLDAENASRQAIARIYLEALADRGLAPPTPRPDRDHVYHQFVVRHPERDHLRAFLDSRGIGALIHYPVPVHLQPAYRDRLPAPGGLARTEEAAATVLSLPMYPQLDPESARVVAAAVASWADARRR